MIVRKVLVGCHWDFNRSRRARAALAESWALWSWMAAPLSESNTEFWIQLQALLPTDKRAWSFRQRSLVYFCWDSLALSTVIPDRLPNLCVKFRGRFKQLWQSPRRREPRLRPRETLTSISVLSNVIAIAIQNLMKNGAYRRRFERSSSTRTASRSPSSVVHRPITRFLPGLPLNPTSNKHWPIWIARGRSSEQKSACFQARILPVISETKVLVWLEKRSSCHGNRDLSILLYTLVLTSVWLKASSDLENFFPVKTVSSVYMVRGVVFRSET